MCPQLKKYFTFEVQVLDDKNVRRRFRASNYQSTTRVKPFICTMPMRLDEGWNQIQFNLSDFTRRAYGTNYIETLRVQIHANCRIRRIYFSDRLYSEEELPPEFKRARAARNQTWTGCLVFCVDLVWLALRPLTTPPAGARVGSVSSDPEAGGGRGCAVDSSPVQTVWSTGAAVGRRDHMPLEEWGLASPWVHPRCAVRMRGPGLATS